MLLGFLFVLFIVTGSALGWFAFFTIKALRQQVDLLGKMVRHTGDRIDVLRQEVDLAPLSGRETSGQGLAGEVAQSSQQTEERIPNSGAEAATDTDLVRDVWTGELSPRESTFRTAISSSVVSPREAPAWVRSLKEQWMIWLGGLSVSLAGVFLVRYSIDQGLLGPSARVALGVAIGLLLHGVAEWLRRRNTGHYNAFAALAGGASVTLYAALLAALLLYEVLTPLPAFVLLSAVALFTMSLAIVHGPVLAIIGILGAYVVPLFVDTGSDSILGLFSYTLIVTAAAILLMRRVYRLWLWTGMLVGSLGWWYLSMFVEAADGYRGFYLAALLYLYIALPSGDWFLRNPDPVPNQECVHPRTILLTVAAVALAFGGSVFAESSVQKFIYYWTPITLVIGLSGGRRDSLKWMPAAAMGLQLLAVLARTIETQSGIQFVEMPSSEQSSLLVYAAWMTGLHCLICTYNFLQARQSLWMAMLLMTPLAWLALSYLLVSSLAGSVYWGTLAGALGFVYLCIAWWRLEGRARIHRDALDKTASVNTLWLIIAGHFAYSLAVTIMLREATLTLAIAAQLVSLVWIIRKFDFPNLDLLIKVLLGVIVARLTLNPWLFTYPADVHWSFWTYGGSTLLAVLACRLLPRNQDLRKWLEAAALHLLVLTLWAEARYWLYDGNIFALRFELLEFAINTAVWSTLALVYYRRYQVSETFRAWYQFCSRVLLAFSLFSYGLVLVPLNPAWGYEAISSTAVFNELLLAFGYPALISLLLYRFYEPAFRRRFAIGACLTGFVFVNLEIRHLWQGGVDINLPTSNGEIYTYTIVWMVLAIMLLLAGSIKFGNVVYKGGMGLLLLVVAKIFLIDTADLEGLLRVASFMGLGLSLLGLAYLYQRYNLQPDRRVPSAIGKSGTSDREG